VVRGEQGGGLDQGGRRGHGVNTTKSDLQVESMVRSRVEALFEFVCLGGCNLIVIAWGKIDSGLGVKHDKLVASIGYTEIFSGIFLSFSAYIQRTNWNLCGKAREAVYLYVQRNGWSGQWTIRTCRRKFKLVMNEPTWVISCCDGKGIYQMLVYCISHVFRYVVAPLHCRQVMFAAIYF
jgi:hypothetical protein